MNSLDKLLEKKYKQKKYKQDFFSVLKHDPRFGLLKFPKQIQCNFCRGTGSIDYQEEFLKINDCNFCHGDGILTISLKDLNNDQ